MTGLPFVFAAWISNKKIPEDFIITFNITTAVGFKHIDEIVATNKFEDYDLKKYYTENINYILNDKKKEGLSLFLKFLSAD
jgi:chorismate dehydratase